MRKGTLSAIIATTLTIPTLAFAQSGTDPGTTSEDTATAPPNDGDLPPPKSDDDAYPEVASPGTPEGGVVEQAGAGGATGYGRAGVLELGGAAGFYHATGLTNFSLTPSIGWFLADNLELSAMINLAYADINDTSLTSYTLLVEPSYHLPFNRTMFGFIGLGLGVGHTPGVGMLESATGFALQPRIGANFMIGRSGILTPYFSYGYTTSDAISTPQGTVIAVSSSMAANIGYTVMW
jgi:hypothetical protein